MSLRASLATLAVAACVGIGGAAAGADTGLQLQPASYGSTSPESERRGQQALSSLDYPWRDLGYTVEFREYAGGRLGSANSRTKRIVVYVKRDQSRQSLRITIAHELGHALDFEHGTQRRHDDYRVIRGLRRSGPWYPCDGCSDYRSHAGDWSEVFAYWLAGPGDFRSQVAGPPTKEQLRRLKPLFAVPRQQSAPSPSPTRATPRPSASSSAPLPVSGNAVPSQPPRPSGPGAARVCTSLVDEWRDTAGAAGVLVPNLPQVPPGPQEPVVSASCR